MVRSPHSQMSELQGVEGYLPGFEFNVMDSITLEENEEVVRSKVIGREHFETTMDRVFAPSKQQAIDRLCRYLKECVRVNL